MNASPVSFGVLAVLALFVLALLVGGGVVIVVTLRRRSDEGGAPNRARRIGCIALAVVGLVGLALVARLLTAPPRAPEPDRLTLYGSGAQLFVDERSVGIEEARIPLVPPDEHRFPAGTSPQEMVAQLLPDLDVLTVTGGSSVSGYGTSVGGGVGYSQVTPHDFVVRRADGRLDTFVLVRRMTLPDAPAGGPPRDIGAVIVRARDGTNRHVRSGSVGVHARGRSLLDRFLGPRPALEFRVEILVDPTPQRYLDDDGSDPGYVVDDFVTEVAPGAGGPR